jgi:hypothetical protein
MTDITQEIPNPLLDAIRQLRSICQDPGEMTSAIDCGSVARITVHITNINSSLLESSRDHANASKRLNDFATTLIRMARKTAPPDGSLASRMLLVAASLRGASAELADSGKKTGGLAPVQAE